MSGIFPGQVKLLRTKSYHLTAPFLAESDAYLRFAVRLKFKSLRCENATTVHHFQIEILDILVETVCSC